MSNAELFEAQGRAYAALKEARSKVATITASLTAYGQSLQQLSSLIAQFVGDPSPKNPSYTNLSEHLKTSLQRVDLQTILSMVDELKIETGRVATLQEQVNRF